MLKRIKDIIFTTRVCVSITIFVVGLLCMGPQYYAQGTNIKIIFEQIGLVLITSISITIIYEALVKKFEKEFISNEIKNILNKNDEVIERIDSFKNEKCNLKHDFLKEQFNQTLSDYWYNSNNPTNITSNNSSPYDSFSTGNEQLKPSSLFHYRMEHFIEEKRRIAENYVRILIESIKNVPDDKDIFLLLDSGSTIYHVFETLCNAYHLGDDIDKQRLSRISIITNNISGAKRLTEIGRIGEGIQADMLFNCFLLPGTVEGKYNAVLGHQTSSYLSDYLSDGREKENTWVLGAITGNYISVVDGIMSRGDFHDSVKLEIIKQSNHISILAPLGKIHKETCQEIVDGIGGNIDGLIKPKTYDFIKGSNLEEMIEGKSLFKSKKVKFISSDFRNYYNNEPNIQNLQNHLNDNIKYIQQTEQTTKRISKNYNDFEYVRVKFNPIFDSRKVMSNINYHGYEALLQYEYPHPSMRSWKRKTLSTSI